MASDLVQERVRTVLATMLQLPESQITAEASSETLEKWDSIAHMNVMLALEETFSVSFTDNEIMRYRSFGDLSTLIEKKQAV
jgi:acyl carrier protein